MFNVGKCAAASAGERPFADIHSGFKGGGGYDSIPFFASIASPLFSFWATGD